MRLFLDQAWGNDFHFWTYLSRGNGDDNWMEGGSQVEVRHCSIAFGAAQLDLFSEWPQIWVNQLDIHFM